MVCGLVIMRAGLCLIWCSGILVLMLLFYGRV